MLSFEFVRNSTKSKVSRLSQSVDESQMFPKIYKSSFIILKLNKVLYVKNNLIHYFHYSLSKEMFKLNLFNPKIESNQKIQLFESEK